MNRVVVIRHHRERVAKCSLQPLVGRPGFRFLEAGPEFSFDAGGHTLLGLGGEVIGPADSGRPLLLLDGTWRYLPAMERQLRGAPCRRTLPAGLRTAYPRTSKLFADPARGLASVEALYAALRLMGLPADTLLDGYRWKEEFLARNRGLLQCPGSRGSS